LRVIRPRFRGSFGHETVARRSRLQRPLLARSIVPTDGPVAASPAIGSLSLCLIVTLTVLSINVAMAMPLPA
jgi:hypothetical protein